MTEILMALSNPYSPISGRKAGRVGLELPGVQAAMLDLESGLLFKNLTLLFNERLIVRKDLCIFFIL